MVQRNASLSAEFGKITAKRCTEKERKRERERERERERDKEREKEKEKEKQTPQDLNITDHKEQ